ncbi:MAG TPA: DUF3999 family protein [Rhizobacter sp.]|nr:DUF3999 family protein [Rhizobacter sp.]
MRETLRHHVAWLLALGAASALAGEAPLELKGPATYHGLTLPLAVLAQTSRADLSDIRVLDARGDPVPYAWADEDLPATQETRLQPVPFYRAPAAASAVTAAQQGGWIIDLGSVKGALLELRLSVLPNMNGIYGFEIESSNDLQRWQTHTPAAQLLSLQHQGQKLEHTDFELNGLRTRYLRLRPSPGSAPPPLTGAHVLSSARYQPPPALQWSEPLAPVQCTAQFCDYRLPRHLPLEQLEWQLATVNTLAPVDVLVQLAPGEPGPARPMYRHRLRDHFKAARHKTAAPVPDAPESWSYLQRSTVYWLRLPEGEVRSPTLHLQAGQVQQLRVQPVGGMAQLGPRPPLLRVGAPAASLVFLAREPAPYRLAWGGESSAGAAIPLAQLMPVRRAGEALPVDTASVQLAPVAPTASAPTPPASGTSEPSRKFWLWGALLGALALMGFMAWSLLRPAKAA